MASLPLLLAGAAGIAAAGVATGIHETRGAPPSAKRKEYAARFVYTARKKDLPTAMGGLRSEVNLTDAERRAILLEVVNNYPLKATVAKRLRDLANASDFHKNALNVHPNYKPSAEIADLYQIPPEQEHTLKESALISLKGAVPPKVTNPQGYDYDYQTEGPEQKKRKQNLERVEAQGLDTHAARGAYGLPRETRDEASQRVTKVQEEAKNREDIADLKADLKLQEKKHQKLLEEQREVETRLEPKSQEVITKKAEAMRAEEEMLRLKGILSEEERNYKGSVPISEERVDQLVKERELKPKAIEEAPIVQPPRQEVPAHVGYPGQDLAPAAPAQTPPTASIAAPIAPYVPPEPIPAAIGGLQPTFIAPTQQQDVMRNVRQDILEPFDLSRATAAAVTDWGQALLTLGVGAAGATVNPAVGAVAARMASTFFQTVNKLDQTRGYSEMVGSQVANSIMQGTVKGIDYLSPESHAPQILNPIQSITDGTRSSVSVTEAFARSQRSGNQINSMQKDYQNWLRDALSPTAIP